MKIYKTSIKDINKVLKYRNHPLNKLNSISKKNIKKIDHYIWWLTQNKKFYYLLKDKKIILFYFFYEIIYINNFKFLISGWYKNPEYNNFLKILEGLLYQFYFLQKIKKNKNINKEVALIYKSNLTMIKFAKHLKWKEIHKNDKLYKDLKKYFNVDAKDFHFYVR